MPNAKLISMLFASAVVLSFLVSPSQAVESPPEIIVESITPVIYEDSNLEFSTRILNASPDSHLRISTDLRGTVYASSLIAKYIEEPDAANSPDELLAIPVPESGSISRTIQNSKLLFQSNWGPKPIKFEVLDDEGEILASKIVFAIYMPDSFDASISPLLLTPIIEIANDAELDPIISDNPNFVFDMALEKRLANSDAIGIIQNGFKSSPNNIDLISLNALGSSISQLGYSGSSESKIYFADSSQASSENLEFLSDAGFTPFVDSSSWVNPDAYTFHPSIISQLAWGRVYGWDPDFTSIFANAQQRPAAEVRQQFLALSSIICQELPYTQRSLAFRFAPASAAALNDFNAIIDAAKYPWLSFQPLADYLDEEPNYNLEPILKSEDSNKPAFGITSKLIEKEIGISNSLDLFESATSVFNSELDSIIGSSLAFGIDADQRKEIQDATAQALEDFLGGLKIITSENLNITSADVEIGITLENNFETPITLKVSVQPEKLGIAGGVSEPIILDAMSQRVVQIPIQAISNGDNTLRISLLSEGDEEFGNFVEVKTNTIIEIGTLTFWIFIAFIVALAAIGIFRTIKSPKRSQTRTRDHSLE